MATAAMGSTGGQLGWAGGETEAQRRAVLSWVTQRVGAGPFDRSLSGFYGCERQKRAGFASSRKGLHSQTEEALRTERNTGEAGRPHEDVQSGETQGLAIRLRSEPPVLKEGGLMAWPRLRVHPLARRDRGVRTNSPLPRLRSPTRGIPHEATMGAFCQEEGRG